MKPGLLHPETNRYFCCCVYIQRKKSINPTFDWCFTLWATTRKIKASFFLWTFFGGGILLVFLLLLFLRNPWLQLKEGSIFLNSWGTWFTVSKSADSHSGSHLSCSVSQECGHFWIQGNCSSFLENLSNVYEGLPPQCWATFFKACLFFSKRATECAIGNLQQQLCFVYIQL